MSYIEESETGVLIVSRRFAKNIGKSVPHTVIMTSQAHMDVRYVEIVARLVDVGKIAAGLIAAYED